MSALIGGKYTVQGLGRPGRLGTWFVLSTVDGQQRGGLRLEDVGLTDRATALRVATAVQATARLQLPGLVAVVDQIVDGTSTWLITACPATPTLAQVLGGGTPLPAAIALLIATDTGQTLARLQQSGSAQGEVSPRTVVLSDSGAALLVETGFSYSLAGTTAVPEQDTTGWVSLLRAVADACAGGQAATLLRQAAQQAESAGGSSGLTAALAVLGAGVAQVPGFGDRAALASFAAATGTGETEATVSFADPSPAPPLAIPPQAGPYLGTAAPGTAPAAAPVGGDQATRLGQRAAEELRRSASYRSGRAAAPAAGSPPPGQVNLRFGQGVPPPATPPAWQLAAAEAAAPPRKRRGKSTLVSLISVLTMVAVGAAVIWFLLNREPAVPLAVSKVTAAPAEPLAGRCDVKVDLVGTISTNGQAGVITYEWKQSDGNGSGVLKQSMKEGETSVRVHLFWEFKGHGTLKARATLKILDPGPVEGAADFTYSCK